MFFLANETYDGGHANEKLAIDKIGFKEISPWLLTEGSAGKK
jgi:hypothetical protein